MNNLRKVRLAADRSQVWLWKRTGIHFSMISMIERGWQRPNEKQMKKLAKALGVTVEALFPEAGRKSDRRCT